MGPAATTVLVYMYNIYKGCLKKCIIGTISNHSVKWRRNELIFVADTQFPPKLHFEDIPYLLDHPDGVNNKHLCSQYIFLVLRIPKRYHMWGYDGKKKHQDAQFPQKLHVEDFHGLPDHPNGVKNILFLHQYLATNKTFKIPHKLAHYTFIWLSY